MDKVLVEDLEFAGPFLRRVEVDVRLHASRSVTVDPLIALRCAGELSVNLDGDWSDF
ncbi:MAG: hypothetical protein R3A79_22595 [Nannocystaceae bacterium]